MKKKLVVIIISLKATIIECSHKGNEIRYEPAQCFNDHNSRHYLLWSFSIFYTILKVMLLSK